MGCYTPLIRIEDLSRWETAADGHKYHPAKVEGTRNLEWYTKKYGKTRLEHSRIEIIPCGQCIGCKLDNSREWANRGYCEQELWGADKTWFITLTYENDYLYVPDMIELIEWNELTQEDETWIFEEPAPETWKGCLVPSDLVQFMKNLRQILKREFNHEGIRFMACGEYGKKYRRSHYHLIVFNCPLPIESFYDPKIRWEKYTYWRNEIIERAWGRDDTKSKNEKGICEITEASWNNIAYTARYITKKQNGKQARKDYAMLGQIPEFFRVSNRPGIGKGYYDLHKDEIYKTDNIMIRNAAGTHYVKPPKYFDKWYEKEHPKEWLKIKQKRKEQMYNSLMIKAQTTSLTMWEQLQIEQATKEAAAGTLKRPEF